MNKIKLWLAVGVIATLALSAVALMPRSASAAGVPWSDSFAEYGMPASPAMWQPTNWDVQVHVRDGYAGNGNDTHLADHGTDCSAPPAQHSISTWQQAVFVCHEHVMTAIANEGYGEVQLTPDRMADWSSGPATISFSLSTARTTARDWFTVDVTPFAEHMSLPFDFGDVDLEGMPAHYIELNTDMGSGGETQWKMVREGSDDFGNEQNSRGTDDITQSAAIRTPYELVISSTGYTFRVGASSAQNPGRIILSGNWQTPLTFTRGILQFGHHSYNPDKCDVTHISCLPDTWHLSNVGICSAIQYSLLRPFDHQVVNNSTGPVTFPAPAPSCLL